MRRALSYSAFCFASILLSSCFLDGTSESGNTGSTGGSGDTGASGGDTGDTGSIGTTPLTIVFATSAAQLQVGVPIALTPAITGQPTSFAIAPALPPGLSLDATTGTISGTPTTASAATLYTLTSGDASASITVNVAAFDYADSLRATRAIAMTPIAPTVQFATVTSYEVTPPLPLGVSLDPSTGAVSGTPAATQAPAAYAVTANTALGPLVAAFSLEIVAPVAFVYPHVRLTASSEHTYRLKTTGGADPLTFTITAGEGSLDAATGELTAADHVGDGSVRVTDALGNIATCTLEHVRVRSNAEVRAVAVGGGALYLGGDFTMVNPQWARGVAALDKSTGKPELGIDFGASFDGHVDDLYFDGNAVFAVGAFKHYRGAPAPRIAKLNRQTWQLDPTFNPGAGFDGDTVAVTADATHVYVAGRNYTFDSAPRHCITKLDKTSGAVDASFFDGTTFCSPTRMIADETALYLTVGQQTTYDGVTSRCLLKVLKNGHADPGFLVHNGTGTICLALFRDGESLYVGGTIPNYAGSGKNGLIKLSRSDGSVDANFSAGAGLGPFFETGALGMLLHQGQLIVHGSFATYSGSPVPPVIAVSPATGVRDPSFLAGVTLGMDTVRSILIDGSDTYVLGAVQDAFHITSSLKKLNGFSAVEASYFSGFADWDVPFTLHDLGDVLLVNGLITGIAGATGYYVTKMDLETGRVDPQFHATSERDTNGLEVHALEVNGTALYVGGMFTNYGNAGANALVKLSTVDASIDQTFLQNGTFNSGFTKVTALRYDGGALFADGDFTTYNGASVPTFAKLNATSGALDTAFMSAVNMTSVASMTTAGADIYLSGAHATTGGNIHVFAMSNGARTASTAYVHGGSALYAQKNGSPSDAVFAVYTDYSGPSGPTDRIDRLLMSSGTPDPSFVPPQWVRPGIPTVHIAQGLVAYGDFVDAAPELSYIVRVGSSTGSVSRFDPALTIGGPVSYVYVGSSYHVLTGAALMVNGRISYGATVIPFFSGAER